MPSFSPRYTAHDQARRDSADMPDAEDPRDPFDVDRARVIHTSAFRRLQGKTQIFGVGEGDFFRTRLTHSMEVAQIGKGLVTVLNRLPALLESPVSEDLVETACLAHDLGHPPFGHNGEKALQACMHGHGGFEANAQNLRILSQLESKREGHGLNLTRASLEAVLKYPVSYSDRKRQRQGENPHLAVEKCYYDADVPLISWMLGGSAHPHRTLESRIMEWADDIAYSVHDLEDGLHSGLIGPQHFRTGRLIERMLEYARRMGAKNLDEPELQVFMADLFNRLEGASARQVRQRRKALTSQLIHRFIIHTSLAEADSQTLLIAPPIQREVAMLKAVEYVLMIRNPRVAALEYKGKMIVSELFRALSQEDSGDLLPEDVREEWEEVAQDEPARLRVVCDYLSGMTDAYALKQYVALFDPSSNIERL